MRYWYGVVFALVLLAALFAACVGDPYQGQSGPCNHGKGQGNGNGNCSSSPGNLTASPLVATISGVGNTAVIAASEPSYNGAITGTSGNTGIATVTGSGNGPGPVNFTLHGVAAGSTTFTVADNHGGSLVIPVNVFGTLTVTPQTLQFTTGSTQTVSATEASYSGVISAASGNTGIATVSPASGSSQPVVFTVTPVAAGQTTLTVTDDHGGSVVVSIFVAGTLTVTPGSLALSVGGPIGSLTVFESNYFGTYTLAGFDGTKISVVPTTGSGSLGVTVSPLAGGSTTITVTDDHSGSVSVPVTVATATPTPAPTATPTPNPTGTPVALPTHADNWCDIDTNNGGVNVTTATGRANCTYAENQKTLNAVAATNAYIWCGLFTADHCFVTQYYKPNVFQEQNPDCPLVSHNPGNPFNAFWALGPLGSGAITEAHIAYHAAVFTAVLATRLNKDNASTGCIAAPFFALQLGQSSVYNVVRTCIDGSGSLSCDPAFGVAALIDEDNSGSRCADMLSVGCPNGVTASTDGSNGVGIKDSNYNSATPGPGQNTIDSERKKYHDATVRVATIGSGGSCNAIFGGASPCPNPYAGAPASIIVNQFGTPSGLGKMNVSPNALDQMLGGNGSVAVLGGMCENCGELQTGTAGVRYSTTHLLFDLNTASQVVSEGRIYKDHVAYSNANPPDVGNAGQTAAFLQDRLDYFARVGVFYTLTGCFGPGTVAVSCTPYDFQVTDENDCGNAPGPCTITPTPNPAGDNCNSDNSPQGNVCSAVQNYPEYGIIAKTPEETMPTFSAPFVSNIGINNPGGGCGTGDRSTDGGAEAALVGSSFSGGVPAPYPVASPDSCGYEKASGNGNKAGVYGRIFDACYQNVSGTMTLIGKCAFLISGRLSNSAKAGNGDWVVPCSSNIGGVTADFSTFTHYLTLANTSFMAIDTRSGGDTDTSGYIMANGYADASVTGGSFTCGTTVVPGGHSRVLFP